MVSALHWWQGLGTLCTCGRRMSSRQLRLRCTSSSTLSITGMGRLQVWYCDSLKLEQHASILVPSSTDIII